MAHGSATAHKTLTLNTLAFAVCFAAWMLNGVLVTFLVSHQVFRWSPVEIGWLLGIPVLTGSIFRLPAGMLTDKFGGKPVYSLLLLLCAVPMFLLSFADSFFAFALCSFGFGLTGVSFSIGVAFTSVWYPKERQGTALGIFGVGNMGAALTTLLAPTLLDRLTDGATNLEGWRQLPQLYAAVLLVMGLVFYLFSTNKKPASSARSFREQLAPLRSTRVWRFGLYYFLLFGCFVAFSQWLVTYFVNAYYLPLVTAGLLASAFSLPSGVTRALGGYMSDRWGPRRVMFWVLTLSCIVSAAAAIPKMEIYSPGQGITATHDGVVSAVTDDSVRVGEDIYSLIRKPASFADSAPGVFLLPIKDSWHEPAVQVGQPVAKAELLAKGVTRIFFQANTWVFAVLVMLLGVIWGIGMATVYKFIPDSFPQQVGVVGGMVGTVGGLGGFVGPILFGYLLKGTGLWTSCWMFVGALSVLCLAWMLRADRPQGKNSAPGPA